MKSDFLKHYGILGMHWGKRKSKKSPYKDSDEHRTKETLGKKEIRHLTNAELKTLTERLNLEKNYREAIKKPPSKIKAFVVRAIENSGNVLVSELIKKQMTRVTSLL
jgi:hypothetical protein